MKEEKQQSDGQWWGVKRHATGGQLCWQLLSSQSKESLQQSQLACQTAHGKP
jgi:hypothetical protein